jgi:acetamidase/formamidase
LLMSRWDFADVDAYVLCSAVMNLRFAQVVNEPMFTVTASLPKGVLPARELF